jgi:hypothetical protein
MHILSYDLIGKHINAKLPGFLFYVFNFGQPEKSYGTLVLATDLSVTQILDITVYVQSS